MIQDIHPHRLDIAFRQRGPEDGDYAVVWRDDRILLRASGGSHGMPTIAALRAISPETMDSPIYLFSLNDRAFYLAGGSPEALDGHEYQGVNVFRTFEPSWLAFAGVTASHLAAWYAQNRFCGACGAPMAGKAEERALACTACGQVVYPRISPAVIVAVTDGPRLLMTRYANRPNARMALVAGFMEVGETLEDTVRREVMEEVGLKVGNIRYYKSQPWAFSGSVLVGFYADLAGPPEITLDAVELQEAMWVDRNDIPQNELRIALTAEMIDKFRNGDFPP